MTDAPAHNAGHHQEQLLATLAHELRNPLAPIANGLHILHDAALPTPQAEIVGMVQRQVETMVRLIDELIEVSRINEREVVLRRQSIALADVLRAAIETCQPRLDARNHRLILTGRETTVQVHADPVRLCQAFADLLNYAAGNTPVDGTIWLTVIDDPSNQTDVVVTVRDNGTSLSPDQCARVTRAFDDPGPGAQDVEEIGLGLTLVHQLVRLHGGTIRIGRRANEQGTEFVVRLPVAGRSIRASGAPASIAAAARLRGQRILVVDDNRDAADSLAMLLATAGAQTEATYDALAALSVAMKFHPQVILLDIDMPGLDGHELAERIRAQPVFRNVLLIAQTGWGQSHQRARSTEAGIDHHMVKPVDFGELERLIVGHQRTGSPDADG